jgi:glutathionylspermidine synthase
MKRLSSLSRTPLDHHLLRSGRSDYRTLEYPILQWSEDCYYSFTRDEVELLYSTAERLEQMVTSTVNKVVMENRCSEFGFCGSAEKLAMRSWKERSPALFSRYDFGFDGTQSPKLFECHSDLPNLLLEAARVQLDWQTEVASNTGQANTIEVRLIECIRQLPKEDTWHLISFNDRESLDVVTYMSKLFAAAHVPFQISLIDTITLQEGILCNTDGTPIKACYKVFGWDSVIIPQKLDEAIYNSNLRVIEPAWKGIVSTKRFLTELWREHPGDPALIPTTSHEGEFVREVRKSSLSWGGNGVEVIKNGVVVARMAGCEMTPPYTYQQFIDTQRFDGYIPTVSVFVIGGKASGICVREDLSPIANVETSRVVPHVVS